MSIAIFSVVVVVAALTSVLVRRSYSLRRPGLAGAESQPLKQVGIENWLSERVCVEQAEITHTPTRDELAARPEMPDKPFAFANPNWEAFKGRIVSGDELWYF